MSEEISLETILEEIRKHFTRRGSYADFGRAHGCSDEYIRQIVAGTRTMPDWVLDHFGFTRTIIYGRKN